MSCLDTSEASAQIPERPVVGLQIGGGVAQFYGDLNHRTEAPALDLQVETLFLKGDVLMGYLAIDTVVISTRHEGDAFPYAPGAELQVLSFLFIPHLCAVLLEDRLVTCGGIGQGTVNVNSEGSRRDYGTWNYQALVEYYLLEGFSLGLVAKYVGRVEQEVAGRASWFTYGTLGASAGFVY